MPRLFDGVDDRINMTPQARLWTNGSFIAAILYRATDTGNWETIYFSGAASLGNPAFYIEPTDVLGVEWNGAAGVTSTITVPVGEWVYVSCAKATGTVTTTFRMFRFSTMAWTTQTPAGTEAPPAGTARTVEIIGAHGAITDFWNGDIAAIGCWGANPTEAEQEQLVFGGYDNWRHFHPVCNWLHLLDQENVGTATQDLSGTGQNQSAITGTAVSTRSDFPFQSWGGEIPFGDDVTGAPDQNITLTPVVNAPTYNGIVIDPEQLITTAGFVNTPTYNGIVMVQEQVITLTPAVNSPTYNGIAFQTEQGITLTGFVNTPTYHGINIVQEQVFSLVGGVNTPIYHGLDITLVGITSNTSVWNGTSWVLLGDIQVWNGSSWVVMDDQRWNGSAWV